MTPERIKEIQEETAYPDSISVQQALMKVWNECERERYEGVDVKKYAKRAVQLMLNDRHLMEAMDIIEDYLNAGSKEARKQASIKAKKLYRSYHGQPYVNKNER